MEVEEEKKRVAEAVNNTLLNVEELRSNFDEFLSLSHPDVLSNLPPLHRALSLLTLARATSTLFAVRLRCTGVHPDSHRLKGDLERISRYQDKLNRYLRLSKDPIHPTTSTKLNFQAANPFIQPSLPDQQARSLREISRNEAGRLNSTHTNFQRKRKYQPPFKPTVQAEFLQNAALDVFDSKQQGGLHKEPIVPILIEDSSEAEDDDDDDDDELEDDELLLEEEEEVELEDEEEFEPEEVELEEDELLDDEDQVVELEEDELLEDNTLEVEDNEKQEIKGPTVLIILDSSDED